MADSPLRLRVTKHMMRTLASVSGALAVLALAACGQSEEEKRAQAQYERELREYRADLAEYRREQRAYRACQAGLSEFKSALEDVDDRLTVGFNYNEYGNEVGDLVVAYNNIDYDNLSPTCLSEVGLPLEKALQQYQKAFESWDKCFEDLDCDPDANEKELQAFWGRATQQLLKADIAIEQQKPGPKPNRPEEP